MEKYATYNEQQFTQCGDETAPDNKKDSSKGSNGTPREITEKERALILKIAEKHYAGPWIKTMLFCGLSAGETALVTGKDIDVQKKLLHVPATKATGKGRIVSVPDALIGNLTGFSDDSYVFSTIYNTPLTKRRIYRWWANFKREMNLELGAKTYRNKLLENKLDTLKNSPEDRDLTLQCLQQTFYSDIQASAHRSG